LNIWKNMFEFKVPQKKLEHRPVETVPLFVLISKYVTVYHKIFLVDVKIFFKNNGNNVMKSFKDSLRFSRNIPSIDGMPKPAVGILTHHEDLALNNLWLDIMKQYLLSTYMFIFINDKRRHFGRLSIEAGKYCYILKEIQGTEEKLLKIVGRFKYCCTFTRTTDNN
ncbi:hypothetical protein Avbf_12509, partial [Armadillidium vulgare]